MKKITLYLLIGYFILQLAVPGYFIYRHYDTLHTGDSYKFAVTSYDPYDPFRGRYVSLRPVLSLYSMDGEYVVLEKDSSGYAVISRWQTSEPNTEQYIKNPQLNRYYMNEKMAPEAERVLRNLEMENETIYLLVRVKNGNYVIEGLYVNDVPIEHYITQT